MDNFYDARRATEDMFDGQEVLGEESTPQDTPQEPQQEGQEQEPQQEGQEQEPQAQEQPTQDNNAVDEAANVAQAAAQAAAQREQDYQRIMSENEQLRQTKNELQQTITQQSQQREQAIIENEMQMPMLDVNRLAFEDDETVQQMQQDYANAMQKYVTQQVLKDVEPALQYAKDGMREKEKREMLEAFSGVDELKGINDMLPQLDYIIEHNKWLANDDIPMDEKYLTAYMIANGVNSANTPPPSDPTAEELMKYYDSNPEFQQMIEKKRLDDIKQSQQVPAMSASNGAVNAALTIKEKPTTWDDASKRTKDMFRGK